MFTTTHALSPVSRRIWRQDDSQHVNNTWFLLFGTFHFLVIGWAVLGSYRCLCEILLFFLTYPLKFLKEITLGIHLGEIGHTQKVASPLATAICPWVKNGYSVTAPIDKVTSDFLEPEEDWYWPVKISQLQSTHAVWSVLAVISLTKICTRLIRWVHQFIDQNVTRNSAI